MSIRNAKVYYVAEEGISTCFDREIEDLFKKYQLRRWASGMSMETGERDLAFESTDDSKEIKQKSD